MASARLLTALAALTVALLLVPAMASAATYVSLGDSYSSGEGAGAYDRASGACHRSPHAWARLLGVSAERHLACSGATIEHVLTRRKAPDPLPQLDALQRLRALVFVDTVLITVGGNDLGFAAKVRSCIFAVSPCLRDRRRLDAELARLQLRLTDAYRRVRAASLAPRVVAVGYPDIAPDGGERDRCLWLSGYERRNIAHFSERLEATLAAAAAAAGISYLSVRDALDDHELCTPRSWMVGVARLGRNWLKDSEQGHPSRRGQRAIAEVVRARLGARAARRLSANQSTPGRVPPSSSARSKRASA